MIEQYEPIGIIATFESLVDTLIHSLALKQVKVHNQMTFYLGKLKQSPVVLVYCGVGKVNAAVCSTILINVFKVKSVIVAGMGGALGNIPRICDFIISKDLINHDMDGTALGYPPGVVPELNLRAIAADQRLLELALAGSKAAGITVQTGRILSGDQFIALPSKQAYLKNLFNGLCVDMEGAAIAQVCWLNSIPFVVILSIAEHNYSKFMREYNNYSQLSARNFATLLFNMLRNSRIPGSHC